ncbi:hypothetical protein N7462_004940 [Penicillium macrosclerotiorum]|uniref:uncharacterized protein n=1 Tax=Penicillium macrosclerotiorum TaxID=303699 RepID=UPI002547C3B3|nr:uncharacterized protein N7462_004940 [Penicillium macrosclerotiorum]KAJ5690548.1 hypothetical protein N7462_004940 [Penicillium macrosclerotiorum]
MVALKKLFQAERSPSRPSTSPGLGGSDSEGPYFSALEPGFLAPGPPSPALPSPGLRAFKAHDVAHHFDQIEKQFEDLDQHLAERPSSSQSQYPPAIPGRPAIPKDPNARHVDLLDALRFPDTDPPKIISPPTSPYNEDVAERNMTRFLRIQYRSGIAGARLLSALYQEDVADRNIAKYNAPSRSLSALSCRSSPPAPGRVRNLSPDGQKRGPRKHNWTSDGDLRNRSASPDDASNASSRASQSSSLLRQQNSAPSLSAEDGQEQAQPPVIQRLGVPPAYKQGKRWSNTPLPDSPTLPPPLSDDNSANGETAESLPELQPPTPAARISSLTPKSLSPPPSAGSTSRKNVRDLSINTQLAAQGRPKIAHKAIQPPTPSTLEMKRAPSIAEVMHSPVPAPSPVQPSPRFKVSEMMDLFNKAYLSTQATSPHPTYESLQDAIVREINSHEAFKRVPVPTAGPPFTPSPTQATFNHEHPGLNRSASAGSISKIIRKGSFKKHRRNAESRQSISTSVPSKSYDRLFRRVSPSPARRRHTDAPAPSPGLLADIRQSQETGGSAGEQLTYMDVLYRASNDKPGTSSSKTTPNSHKRGRSESVSNLSTIIYTNSERPNTPGAVYCMQAHSTPSKDSRSSLSPEDSDDDIIHLPSVTVQPPRVQIEGVDENNVRYVIDSATATDAQRLMGWPQRMRRANSPQPTCENSLSPLSRARIQLRGTRSVETY